MRIKIQSSVADRPSSAGQGLKTPLFASVVLHSMLVLLALFGGVLVANHRGEQWGDIGAEGGGVVPVNLAPSVSLPAPSARRNPLASDTRELNPVEVKATERAPEPPKPSPNELQLSEKELKRKMAELEKRRAQRELAELRRPDNAIPGTTSSGRASGEMYSMATGHGAGGMEFGAGFGNLYGWYVRTVRECIARHWDRSRVDAVVRASPRVYVEFDIQRDGTIRNERITTSSSVPSVDREALRAVQACSGRRDVGSEARLPELPRDFAGASVHVEVWFEFRQ